MSVEDNSYPNPGNYPAPSFKRPVPPPLVDPDEGDLLYVGYNPAWTPALMGAVTQLELPSTWEGDHEEKIAALNGVSLLKFLLTEPVAVSGGAPTPFWDDATDTDDQETPEDQVWYGILDGTFEPEIADWVIAGFIAATGEIGGAIWFLTIAPKFRLAWRTGDVGGVIRVFIDGADYGTVDTYSEEPGVLEKDYIADPDEEEHTILMVLEELHS